MNEKGGMDDEEFEKYFTTNILALYPKTRDAPGRRMMVCADSGPGRTCLDLRTWLRARGIYLYPGVPNTTAVTQETDWNYGPFKTQIRDNLANIIQRRIELKKSTSSPPWIVGLVVFGSTDPETGLLPKAHSRSPLQKKPARGHEQSAGKAPLTRKRFEDKKVRRELGDAEDDVNTAMAALQEANDSSTQLLT
ncbi:hypothetical protein ACHAWF_014337 [Thalassiosira exigua]